jgi:hypothetical protein
LKPERNRNEYSRNDLVKAVTKIRNLCVEARLNISLYTGIKEKDMIQPTKTYNETDTIVYSNTGGQKLSGGMDKIDVAPVANTRQIRMVTCG